MSDFWFLIIAQVLSFVLCLGAMTYLLRQSRGGTSADQENILRSLERWERGMKEELGALRRESQDLSRQSREETQTTLKSFNDTVLQSLTVVTAMQNKQLGDLTQSNEKRMETLREAVEKRLTLLQEDNGKKLEMMRATVDEKLHATLEKRLGDSFKIVSERLELVHKGLGEMQTLAAGVGDLKKVLTNVKTRGIWGEMQLGNLLEQFLTPEQYSKNVATKPGSNDRVEYVINMPQGVWLPIDAKFPQEDYQRLLEAQEQANISLVEEIGKQLENRIKAEAKDIRDKYLSPPQTTDFGIMFLPVEGLYAEILRRPGLVDMLQRDYRVTVAGPTNLAGYIHCLQMGFRTLAIEKRSSDVWQLLSNIKKEFGKFGDLLEKTRDKIEAAGKSLDDAARESRTIERKLRNVEILPDPGTLALLGDVASEAPDGLTVFAKEALE